ncbi:hypothetical protein [Actinoplanes sp. CA-252034]|uniref:hypothetical protein n=1 Tax=Actinoplanes sp. CA-252034 TaxID=3239906 RepID=UPI003D99A22D
MRVVVESDQLGKAQFVLLGEYVRNGKACRWDPATLSETIRRLTVLVHRLAAALPGQFGIETQCWAQVLRGRGRRRNPAARWMTRFLESR